MTVEKIQELTVFRTTDGLDFGTMDEACNHQEEIDFRVWCETNICVGGEWSSSMVVDAILRNWKVIPA